ncbi:MAG TPA: right-handed parallel beta-helix repeat-containing protein [Bryobacteraceae bacterium]|nr:right-handed parallel beta-helix repeat-containing protein [Bryobacteraceae bacterium]
MILAALLVLAIPPTCAFRLPAGVTEIPAEIRLPDGAHDLTVAGGEQTTLRAAANFSGRAIFSCHNCRHIRFEKFSIDGNRAALERPLPMAPSADVFATFYSDNGILVDETDGLTVEDVHFTNITNFAILVNHSSNVAIDRVSVSDSGSHNAKHRNNTTGGILLEEGVDHFTISNSDFRNILGNGVWTHSRRTSPRNTGGRIADNRFSVIARDAIQVGHATEIRVEENTGDHIGYPVEAIDVENDATPVAIDTAGNVDKTVYTNNRFDELDGKCIDLDGFHDGEVSHNVCVNKGSPESYAFGHFGIVVNDWNPDMKSEHITISDNTIDGAKFGGLFLLGSNHVVVRNRFVNLNKAHCNENAAKFGCVAIPGEPDVLRAGIYLGRIAAVWAEKRADASRGHIIRDNVITGFKMSERCIMAAPGVSLKNSTIENNRCSDQ